MYDVFLSHNRKQKPWVRLLCKVLRGLGLRVFFDEDSIAPGQNIISAIENGLATSQDCLLILSEQSLSSKWVGLEIAIAAHREIYDPSRRLIPIQISDIAEELMPIFLRAKSAVDLRDHTTREARLKFLIEHIGNSRPESVSSWTLRPLMEIDGLKEPRRLRVCSKDDLNVLGWSATELLDRLLSIDYELMEGLNANQAGSSQQWAPLFTNNPSTWRILVDDNNDIGAYWHFTPLFDDEYRLAQSGALSDSSISLGSVVPIDDVPGVYDIYIVAVCIRGSHRAAPNTRLLFESFLDALETLARSGSFVSSVTANAYTDDGISLCRAFAMDRLCKHLERGEVYFAPIHRFLSHQLAAKFPGLRSLYQEAGLLKADAGHGSRTMQ
jgi:hypothetical protein